MPITMTDAPCPRCLRLYEAGKIRGETVMPMPLGAHAPMAVFGKGKCCLDCASADTLLKCKIIPITDDRESGFLMARIAVGNDRQDQFRCPGIPLGLVARGLVRPSAAGDLERHWAWLDDNCISHNEKIYSMTWAEVADEFPEAGAKWDVYAKDNGVVDTQFQLVYFERGEHRFDSRNQLAYYKLDQGCRVGGFVYGNDNGWRSV